MSENQLYSLGLLLLFVVIVATINILMINIMPKYKVKLSRWVWISLIIALWMETKDKYVNSILPVFFLLFFIFEIVFAVASVANFHKFRRNYFFRLSRKFLTLLLIMWYISFFILNIIFK